jgi:hypothetical protein
VIARVRRRPAGWLGTLLVAWGLAAAVWPPTPAAARAEPRGPVPAALSPEPAPAAAAASIVLPASGATPARGSPPVTPGAPDRDAEARELLETRLGLSPQDARLLLERLTPDERREMVARAEELGVGGSPALVALGVAAAVAFIVILVLELMGRRVVSRP